MRRQRAVITVFFSLLSVIFLAVSFTVTEAVRVAGARAACANASSLGLWSVFSEYDNDLLEDYGLFAVNGGSEGNPVSEEYLLSKLDGYVKENENVTADMSGKLPGLLMDPWKISASRQQVDRYALLTDGGGNYYYQQAVEYMRKTAWANALGKLEAIYSDSQKIRQAESEFEARQEEVNNDMKSFDQDIESAKQELGMNPGSSGAGTAGSGNGDGSAGDIVIVAEGEDAERLRQAEEEGRKKNPLEQIESLRRRSVLELVLGKGKVSTRRLQSESLFSKRSRNQGKMILDTPRGGKMDNLLFREYLLDHFRNCSDRYNSSVLNYQLEYVIMGKYSDEQNLKKIAKKLLFLREGMNYTFLVTSPSCNAQISALAMTVVGWTGKPVLVEAFKHAVLLAWAYGESLFDVRILVNMTPLPQLRRRSLDLIELNMRTLEGKSSFRVDNCVIGMTSSTDWEIPAVFGRVPTALLGTGEMSFHTKVEGGFAY